MLAYTVRRLLAALLVLLAAFTVTFLLLYQLPSDPVALMFARGSGAGEESVLNATQEQIDAVTAEFGLDRPPLLQYFHLLSGYLRGDMGTSFLTGLPVLETILRVLPNTLTLAVWALGIGIVLGLAVGALATASRSRALRSFLLSLPAFGSSAPTFWVALVLLQIFSFQLGLLPALGFGRIESVILPAVSLAIPLASGIAQVFAESSLAVAEQEFVQLAATKGISRSAILLRHIFRNSLLPVTTVIGLSVGGVLGGAVVIETVFTIDGVGKLTQSAVEVQDIPLVQGIVCFLSLLFVTCNLLVDLAYPLLDPRAARRATGALA